MTDTLAVEVVFALPGRVWRRALTIPAGSTAGGAIDHSGLASVFREVTGEPVGQMGVYGRRVAATHPLSDGDRLELYRPLTVDPRERRRAKASGTGRDSAGGGY